MKIVKLRKGQSSPGTGCPYCRSSNVTSAKKQDVKTEQGYAGQTSCVVKTVNEYHECICKDCLKPYIVDMGESTYVTYNEPYPTNCLQDEFCLAEYGSDWYPSLAIYVANNPEHSKEKIYYMFYDEDISPIFLSQKLAKTFVKNIDEAREYGKNVWMSRYR